MGGMVTSHTVKGFDWTTRIATAFAIWRSLERMIVYFLSRRGFKLPTPTAQSVTTGRARGINWDSDLVEDD